MTTEQDSQSSANRFTLALRQFTTLSLALFTLIVVLRIFEVIVISTKHALPMSLFELLPPMISSDIIFFFALSGFLSIFIVSLAIFAPTAAQWTYYAVLAVGGIIHFGLIQYFSVTLVPLGTDFFGYTIDDIQFTVKTSSSIGFKTFLPYIILVAIIWLHRILSKRMQFSKMFTAVFTGISLLMLFLSPLMVPSVKDFSSDVEYNLSINKSHYFAVKAVQYFTAPSISTSGIEEEYPLVRNFPYHDVLGPFLESTPTVPNIVVIVAEGLGRDFVGAGARYGGFLPFVDSLTRQSLYWENFLSTSGRTFEVLPSLFGSLPYGDKGFNELEYKMPRHLSLIRLLKQNNYHVNFMYGGNKNFDKKDVFLEREQTDLIMDESKFGVEYHKAAGDQSGFTWGFPDGDVFRKAIEILTDQRPGPRMDMYLTMSTHEPYIPPNRPYYLKRFHEMLSRMKLTPERRNEFATYRDQFASLIYFDDALRYLLTEYSKRPDYRNTIIFITGDHRIIPIPSATKIDRFHVPLIVLSPLVKKPVTFSSVSSHLDVTPSILALLKSRYNIRIPVKAHWLGNGIDTTQSFRNIHSIPFIRVKEEIADYLDGSYFISGEQLFELKPGMDLEEIQNDTLYQSVFAKLQRFKQINKYVIDENKLYPQIQELIDDDITPEDMIAFKRIDSLGLDLDKLFLLARQKAFNEETDEARLICRRILAAAPNFHDARALLARTFAWKKEYETAKRLLNNVLLRDESYADAYTALADVQLWNDSADASLDIAQKGLALYPDNEELHVRTIKALLTLKRTPEAKSALKKLYQLNPNNADYETLNRRIAGR